MSYSCNGAHLRDPAFKCEGDSFGGCRWHLNGQWACDHSGRVICENCEEDVSYRGEMRQNAELRAEVERLRTEQDIAFRRGFDAAKENAFDIAKQYAVGAAESMDPESDHHYHAAERVAEYIRAMEPTNE